MTNVETKTTQNGQEIGPVTVEYDFGANLQETIERFGEELVHNNAVSSIKIALQNYIRGLLKQGKSVEEIQKIVADWKPGMRKPTKSKVDKLKDAFGSMSPEDRAALLKELKAAK